MVGGLQLVDSSLIFSSAWSRLPLPTVTVLLGDDYNQRSQIMTLCCLVLLLSPDYRTRQDPVSCLQGGRCASEKSCCSVTLLFQDSNVISHDCGDCGVGVTKSSPPEDADSHQKVSYL